MSTNEKVSTAFPFRPFNHYVGSSEVSLPTCSSSSELIKSTSVNETIEKVEFIEMVENNKLTDNTYHMVKINDWEWNSRQTKPWLCGIRIKRFPSNYISTTKYTWWNFPFLNLFYQCRRVGTLYFIFQMIVSLIPGVTTVPAALILLPVIFIICVNMLREGGEDFLRYLNDRKVNHTDAFVLREGQFVRMDTGSVRVGDIVRIEQGQIFPADLMLVGSSQEDSCCKIETSNLDGESSLKSRFPPKLSKTFNNESLMELSGIIKCQEPNENLNKFRGSINVDGSELPLSHQNLLLKGCKLSTEIAYGVVIYTGKDTKSLRNMNKTNKVKFSLVNKMLNIMVGIMFSIQMICCFTFTAVKSYYEFREGKEFYMGKRNQDITDGSFVVLTFLSHIIMFAHYIPVSLLVSFELVKMVQAWFISMDNELAQMEPLIDEPDKNQLVSSLAISSDLNCDLAKIDMVFSDKTGTLTENSMVFKKCSVGTDLVFNETIEKGRIGDWIRNNSNHDQFFMAINTLLSMSLCHNVSLRKRRKGNINVDEVFFEGESIDEVALLLGAKHNQFELKYFSEKKTMLDIFGKEYTFERVSEIPFTPERKRMSTIFKLPLEFLNDFPIFSHVAFEKYGIVPDENGQLTICFSKGADTFLYPLLNSKNYEKNYEKINVQSSQFASEGLRTLLFCFKFVDENLIREWLINYNAAKSSITKSRKEVIEMLESQLEKNLEIVGCTAVEDILQDQVPETISFLIEAGIQVWMLTGDKRETAIKIAGIAGFIHEHSQVFTLDGDSSSISNSEICELKVGDMLSFIQGLSDENQKEIVLVLDGHAFTHCLSCQNFEHLVKKCKTVVFCRSTPKQKSQLVQFAKNRLKKRVLSIGDGVNDVPMIQQADVGIGIIGKEGNQAKMSSDFAIPKFRMLKRLLAVHGRYSYKRIADFIHYYIYINLGIVFIGVVYAFYVQFSGQSLNEDLVIIFSTLFFMQMNPLSFGIFEKDISEKYLQDPKYGPKLYRLLKKENIFNLYTFTKWIGGGMLHMIMIFFICMYSTESSLFTNGKDDGFWAKGVLITSCSFLVVHLKSFLEFENVTPFHFVAVAVCLGTFYGFNWIYATSETSPLFQIWFESAKSPLFWFVHLLCLVTCLGFDFTFHALKQMFYPDYYQVVRRTK